MLIRHLVFVSLASIKNKKLKIQFSCKKKVSVELSSNSWFAFTNRFSLRCMKRTKRIARANCLEKKATLHKEWRKGKNDFDDMDQSSSQMQIWSGGLTFLHSFGCKHEDASRNCNLPCELTKPKRVGLNTFSGKILWSHVRKASGIAQNDPSSCCDWWERLFCRRWTIFQEWTLVQKQTGFTLHWIHTSRGERVVFWPGQVWRSRFMNKYKRI